MNRIKFGFAALLLAACGPGADVNGFPSAYASAYCHFIYHCCTPADRANQANPFNFVGTEQTLNFDNESDCDAKLGEISQIQAQPVQASVKDKRMTYNQTPAQACLDALSNAASSCDPNAIIAANTGTGNSCNGGMASYVTGLVAAGGTCTFITGGLDCAAVNSVCTPLPQDGGTPVVSSAGSCTSPPAVGAACNGVCAAGACCGGANSICVAYLPVGATCTPGCSATPCDPSKDYCNAGTCAALIANGGACVPANFGSDCVSGNCDPTAKTCQSMPTAKLEVCVGNPDGF